MAKQKKQTNRDDFTTTTVTKLGKRVGFVCSNPACRIHTVGPNEASDKTSNIGKAAHICAAAENGPRYDPNMTPAQRGGIDNGIWLCGNCHDIVDADPVRYPADLLRQWKQDAEDAASNRLGKPVEAAAKNNRQFPLQAKAIPLNDFVSGSRDTEMDILQQDLEKEHKVFLWGFGGMGKSETAIKLALRMRPESEVFLLHYQNSMRDTILKLNFEGYKLYTTANTVEAVTEADYRQRMKMLREGYRDSILIVDNFDVEGKSFDELTSEPAYQELICGGFKLIFTTRSPVGRPEWEIKPLTPEYQLKLMRNLSQGIRATDEELLELIEAVDGHTLTLALMAKTLKASLRVTAKQMLDAIRGGTLGELNSRAVASNKDRDTTQRRIEAHLATLFDLSSLDDDARTVLACATLLPDGGIEPGLFLDCLPPEQQEALEKLTDINWLTLKDGLITIHPVMRQVCRMSLKPDDTVCGAFLEELWKQYDEKEYNAGKFQQMAVCFATAADTLRSRNAWYPERSGFLFIVIANPDSGLEYCQKALAVLQQHDPENGEMLGTVWHDIGCAYGDLGDHRRALEYKEKALEIRKQTLPPDHPDLARSYNNVGSTYRDLGDYRRALEYKEKALEILKQVLPPDHPDLAQSYNNVGSIYSDLRDHRRALEYVEKALEILKQVLPPDHPDLALSYNNVGSTYRDLGDHRGALEYKEKALEIWMQVLPPDHPDLALSYNNVGSTYSDLGDHRRALEYQEKALEIRKQVLPPDHPNLALSYYNTGLGHWNLRRPKEGIARLLKAQEIYEKSLPAGHPDLTRIYDDLSLAYTLSGRQKEARRYRRLTEENRAKTPK